MSQSRTELEQLRARCKSLEDSKSWAQVELVIAKQSATDALAKLKGTKELVSQACAELEKVRESESLAQTQCKKAQIELESILLNSIHPFPLLLSLG